MGQMEKKIDLFGKSVELGALVDRLWTTGSIGPHMIYGTWSVHHTRLVLHMFNTDPLAE